MYFDPGCRFACPGLCACWAFSPFGIKSETLVYNIWHLINENTTFMADKKYTQERQVVDTLRKHGGYATLGNLYHFVDTTCWATKTPNESIP